MSYIIVPFTKERFKGLNALKTFDKQKCVLMTPKKTGGGIINGYSQKKL